MGTGPSSALHDGSRGGLREGFVSGMEVLASDGMSSTYVGSATPAEINRVR
jgi:hypothetical protein